MSKTTIRFFDGDLGDEEILIRCDLSQASSPVQVDYRNDPEENWEPTQYQCADVRHRLSGLIEIGKRLAADAIGVCEDDFDCETEELD